MPVAFTVIRNRADFPGARDDAALRAVLGRADAALAEIPAARITVPTNRHGVATSPPLTPDRAGAVTVTASVDGARGAARWTLHAIPRPPLGPPGFLG